MQLGTATPAETAVRHMKGNCVVAHYMLVCAAALDANAKVGETLCRHGRDQCCIQTLLTSVSPFRLRAMCLLLKTARLHALQ